MCVRNLPSVLTVCALFAFLLGPAAADSSERGRDWERGERGEDRAPWHRRWEGESDRGRERGRSGGRQGGREGNDRADPDRQGEWERNRNRNRDRDSGEGGREISIDDAVQMVQRRYDARVVRAESQQRGGRKLYVLRLLNKDGRVWTVTVDAASGQVR